MTTTALPPGPTRSVLAQSVNFWRRPEHTIRAAHAAHGDMFTLRVQPAGEIVFVADADLVRQVFTGSPDVFHAGEGNAILKPVMGPRSLLLLDGPEHLSRRKLMLPAFHGGAVRRLVATMREIAEAQVRTWPRGEAFALLPRTNALTLEIILRAVFGVHEEERLERLRRLLPKVVRFPLWMMLMWVRPGLGRVPPWSGHRRLIAEVDDVLLEEIARRREVPDLEERPDVLSMLVRARGEDGEGLDDRELRDQLVTLLLAGHETTATGLAWLFERLVREPRVAAEVRRAVAEDDDAYLDGVVKEILRLRPVIDRVARRLTEPVELGGWSLPAGTLVAPAIGIIGLDPRQHPDAFAFRPERWLGDEGPGSYSWLPFGGGTRRCIGATFAQVEMREVLKVVTSRVGLRAPDPRAERQLGRHITIAPQQGSRVICEERTETALMTA